MKNIFIAISAMLLLICGCTASRSPITTPEVNTKVKDERVSEMLLGHCSRSCLLQAPYKEWFIKNYDEYAVDTIVANKVRSLLTGKTIVVFMGTWCGDSRREVPRLIKILDYCGFPDEDLNLVMVDYRDGAYKQSPQHEEKGKNIFRVPTIIAYSGKKEVGRIIEFPKKSLEGDLLTILSKEAYAFNYGGGDWMIKRVEESDLKKLYADSLSIGSRLKNQLRNSFELNSVGHVLLDRGEKEKSLFVFELNKDLYPEAANVWNGLARVYIALNRIQDATAALQRSQMLEPNNADAMGILKKM